MKLGPIVERLKAAELPRVYGALELAGLKDAPGRLPQYYVLPEASEAGPNRTSGVHDQLVTVSFLVVIMLEAAARREDGVADALDEAETAVIAALSGWTHPQATRACDFAGGRLLSVDGRTLSWGARFSTAWRLRKVDQ